MRTEPLTLTDFTSARMLGKMRPTDDPEALRLAGALSVFRTEAQAQRNARRMPILGAYLAEVAVPSGAPVHSERTLRTPEQHTL